MFVESKRRLIYELLIDSNLKSGGTVVVLYYGLHISYRSTKRFDNDWNRFLNTTNRGYFKIKKLIEKSTAVRDTLALTFGVLSGV